MIPADCESVYAFVGGLFIGSALVFAVVLVLS
jgi:hypothetical protein